MSMPAEVALAAPSSARDAGLWLGAGAAVLAAHLAVAYMLQRAPGMDAPFAFVEAMEVDLAPLPVTQPQAVATETIGEETVDPLRPVEEMVEPVEPETAKAEPVETEITEADPVETVEPELVEPELADAEPAQPVVSEVEPDVVEAVEPAPEIVASEVIAPLPDVMLPPPSRPVEAPAKTVEEPVRKQAKKPAEKPRKTQAAETKPKTSETKKSASSQASKAATAPKVNRGRWDGQVRAAVARRVARIRGKSGTVNVRFVVSASGAIVSVRVAGSSGDGRLDSAALSAVRSARVPAPPAGLAGDQHLFSIPLTFQ